MLYPKKYYNVQIYACQIMPKLYLIFLSNKIMQNLYGIS